MLLRFFSNSNLLLLLFSHFVLTESSRIITFSANCVIYAYDVEQTERRALQVQVEFTSSTSMADQEELYDAFFDLNINDHDVVKDEFEDEDEENDIDNDSQASDHRCVFDVISDE